MHYHHMAEAAEVGVDLGSADLTGVSPTLSASDALHWG